MENQDQPDSKSDQITKDCNQILGLWSEGYSDIEIREKLNLSPQQFILRLRKIKEDEIVATESMLLYEKLAIKLLNVYKRTIQELDNVTDQRLVAPLLRTLLETNKAMLDTAQRLNAVDPQRFVVEHISKEKKDVEAMSLEELSRSYWQQLQKEVPTAH